MEDIIKLVDENGIETEYEFLDYVKYNGEDYAVMLIHGENTGETYIFKVAPDAEGEDEFEYMDDETICDAVFDKFKADNSDFYTFE